MQSQISTDQQTWVKFFRNALIPQQYAAVYANKFAENRIRFDMLGDLSRELLQEMGITALGDCLSILKHARTIDAALNEASKKDQQLAYGHHDDSPQSSAVKKRVDLAKKLIGTFTADDTTSSPSSLSANGSTTNKSKQHVPTESTSLKSASINAHSLSNDLQSRLNFGGSGGGSSQPVVKFNEDSLTSTKVIVSSTTDDRDRTGKNKLKRKLDEDDDDDDVIPRKSLDNVGSLKKRLSVTIPTSTSPKQAPSLKSRLSLTPSALTKTIRTTTSLSSSTSSNGKKKPLVISSSITSSKIPAQTDSLYSSRLDEPPLSVFDRIRTSATAATSPVVTRHLVGEANKAKIVRSLGGIVVTAGGGLTTNKQRLSGVATTRPKIVTFKQPHQKPSLKDRLSFNK